MVVGLKRLIVLAAALFYAEVIHYAHVAYLNPVWEYYGYTYSPPSLLDASLMAVLVLAGAALLPMVVSRPSSIVVLLLFVVVYVPTVVLTLSLETNRLERYGASLLMLGVVFALACAAARYRFDESPESQLPGNGFAAVMLILWAVCCSVLVVSYRDVMTFALAGEIYDQRAAGAATSLAMGYVQTYFSNVLSPGLIAFGAVKRRWSLVAVGAAGCVVMYMVTAQRTIILLPLAMLVLYIALRVKPPVLRTSSFLMVALGTLVAVSATYYLDNVVASLFSLFLVNRTLGLPALTFSQYYDVFDTNGFTWWSHIRGFDLLIAPPASYWNDTIWPNLGRMIGDRIYQNADNNANANLFVGDGVAAAGAFGVVVIGIFLAAWLVMLDYASKGWDRTFALLVTVPVALSLTNGHFFTTLLSFGGLFWMLTFQLYKPGKRGSNT